VKCGALGIEERFGVAPAAAGRRAAGRLPARPFGCAPRAAQPV